MAVIIGSKNTQNLSLLYMFWTIACPVYDKLMVFPAMWATTWRDNFRPSDGVEFLATWLAKADKQCRRLARPTSILYHSITHKVCFIHARTHIRSLNAKIMNLLVVKRAVISSTRVFAALETRTGKNISPAKTYSNGVSDCCIADRQTASQT